MDPPDLLLLRVSFLSSHSQRSRLRRSRLLSLHPSQGWTVPSNCITSIDRKGSRSEGAADVSKRSALPVDVIVGQNIRICRMQRRMSQTELGTQIGVTFQQIQKYEKG